MRKAFTFIELLVVIGIIIVLCGCLIGPAGFDAMYRLLAGWVLYLIRLAGERNINWFDLSICLVCLTGLTLGVHCFGLWFAASRPTPTPWPWSRTLKLIGLLMLMFVAGITGIGVTHEMVWLATAKEELTQRTGIASPRTYSVNNLKQISIAVHAYHDVNNHLPFGGTFDEKGRGVHGWQTMLLPYVEQQALLNRIDLKQPWNAPINVESMKSEITVFLHPSIPNRHADGFALSHYAGNVHVLGMKPLAMKDITDGTSNTMLMGEVSQSFKPWGSPTNWRDPALGLLTSPNGFGGPASKGTNISMADGTVRWIRNDISPAVLKAISTPRGGESPEDHDVDR